MTAASCRTPNSRDNRASLDFGSRLSTLGCVDTSAKL